MKTLKFYPHLVKQIIEGEKTLTGNTMVIK